MIARDININGKSVKRGDLVQDLLKAGTINNTDIPWLEEYGLIKASQKANQKASQKVSQKANQKSSQKASQKANSND